MFYIFSIFNFLVYLEQTLTMLTIRLYLQNMINVSLIMIL